jgi:hypothetical protein
MAYHPQTNGQVKRYNRTVLASLRGYVSKRQEEWDEFKSDVTFSYNCRVHSSKIIPPFELKLTRSSPIFSLHALPRADEVAPATLKREFLELLKTIRLRAVVNLHKVQARYKKSYVLGVVRKNTDLSVGDEAYLRIYNIDVGLNHKLESLVQGPDWVMENSRTTLRLILGSKRSVCHQTA